MQRFIKSLAGLPTDASIQKSLTDVRSSLEKARGHIQFTRQQPRFQTFETTAKFAQQVANETAKVASTIQEYGNQQTQTLHISIPEATITQLKGIINSAQVSATQIAGGIQTARAYTYPEAIVHYTDQVAGTLEAIAILQGQLVQLMSDIQALVDMAEQERRAIQAQQQAARQAVHDRNVYLAQYGGIDPEEIIAHVQAGSYPAVPAGVITRKGEIVLFATAANLSEDRTTTKYVGGSAGYSVPLGHGFRFRVGSFHGQAIRSERLTQIDQGTLIITTQRIIFTGNKSTITIPVAKVLHTVIYKNGIDVRAENRKQREVFLCPQPLLTNTFVLIACHLLSA